jgi:hypothetical protein
LQKKKKPEWTKGEKSKSICSEAPPEAPAVEEVIVNEVTGVQSFIPESHNSPYSIPGKLS